ncbi:hypothetical protein ACFCZT_07905 [Streptomyces sp. NPDC056230]|uniref:hypothetical protein n=1 Tax=Streptomyces sp. NPDC056230 TaxID=3345754 RepID=UPI0035DDC924
MTASPIAFEDAAPATVRSLTGDTIEVRPFFDKTAGRTVVQLSAAGFSVLLDNGSIPDFTTVVSTAAYLGEISNVAAGTPTPYGETA